MTDDRVEELLFDINGKLASISTKLDAVSELSMNHETRIRGLEESMKEIQSGEKADSKEESFKTEILKLLAKALLIALVAIGSLTGATSMLKEVLSPTSIMHIQQ